MHKPFSSLAILISVVVISCSSIQTFHIQCPDLSSNSRKRKPFKSPILTLARTKSYKQNKQKDRTQLTVSIMHKEAPKALFIETSSPFLSNLSNSLLTASYEHFEVSFDKMKPKIDSPPVNSSNFPKDKTNREQESMDWDGTISEQRNNDYYDPLKEKDPYFIKNLVLGWLLTIASLLLFFLSILSLVIPVLAVLLLIIAMIVGFRAVEKSWDALTAKGVGPLRMLAIPPLIASALISFVLLLLVVIISAIS